MVGSECFLGCQRYVGSQEMCLGPCKKILGTILIQFLNFHIFSFLHSIWPSHNAKKENTWNFKNIIKIVPKNFIFVPNLISRHPTCPWHPMSQSEVIILSQTASKKFIGTNVRQTWFFRIQYRWKGGFQEGYFLFFTWPFATLTLRQSMKTVKNPSKPFVECRGRS